MSGEQKFDEANALYEEGDYAAAAERYAAALLEPDIPADGVQPMHYYLALCYVHLSDPERALEHAAAAGEDLAAFRKMAAAHGYRNFDADSDLMADYWMAYELFDNGDYQTAANELARLLVEPAFPADQRQDGHWWLAECYARLGDAEMAAAHAKAAGRNREDLRGLAEQTGVRGLDSETDVMAVYNEAMDDLLAGSYQEAADGFARVLLEPAFPAAQLQEGHWWLAECYGQLGDEERALAQTQAAGRTEDEYRALAAEKGFPPPH